MAAGNTFTPIASTTLGSNQASVNFNSFSGYTDLTLVMSVKCTATGGANCWIRFNGDTATNYSQTSFYGTSPNASTNHGSTNASAGFCLVDDTNFFTIIYHINNYANTTTYKTIIGRGGATTSGMYTDLRVSNWRNTAAITSIDILLSSGSYVTGSTFTLYGILAA